MVDALRAPPPEAVLWLGPVSINLDRWRVEYDGRNIELTRGEKRVLAALVARKGQVVTSMEICAMSTQWGYRVSQSRGSLRVHVYRLRRVFRELGAPDMIGSVWGHGYIAREPAHGAGA